jgi:hypothetical protein
MFFRSSKIAQLHGGATGIKNRIIPHLTRSLRSIDNSFRARFYFLKFLQLITGTHDAIVCQNSIVLVRSNFQ